MKQISNPRPRVDIYDFDLPEELQGGVEPLADTRSRMNIALYLVAVAAAIVIFAAGAAYGAWIAQ